MAGEITLTSAMRSNLYSLQGTASTMSTIQQRLSTGKKVNSALDNPNNYFAASALTNRASDLSALLDGMGQAIEALKTANQGITSAQKIVDQMKSVANSAAQSLTSASNATGTNVAAYTALGSGGGQTAVAMGASASAAQYSLTELTNGTNSLNILNGDNLTVQVGTGATYTFTVGASAANNSVKGNGGGTTLQELSDWMNVVGAGSLTASSGALTVAANASGVTISGKLASALDVDGNAATGGITGAVAVNVRQYTNQASATGSTLLSELTDDQGKLLDNADVTEATNTGPGTYLSLAVGGGSTKTINITATTTVQDVLDSINSISGLSASLDSTGKLKVVNNNSTAVTIGGTAAGLLADGAGASDGSTIAANGSVSRNIYHGYGKVVPANLPSTDLVNLQAPAGQARLADGDQLKLTIDGVTTTIGIKASSPGTGEAQTVSQLMTELGKISGVVATLDNTTGKLDIRSSNGKTITFGGNAAAKLSLPPSVAAGQSTLSGGGISATYLTQFDELRSQLDKLVADTNYKGINLVSSTGNNPLSVTFNEQAINANKLVINAVDLTTKGLNITDATSNWKDTATIQETLAQLTNAATTLRETASTLGQNLATVQTRQDFTNNMIATLKSGADDLTLADMNEESANMLALQTRQQLGIQSLSLASQANQAVMRLFG